MKAHTSLTAVILLLSSAPAAAASWESYDRLAGVAAVRVLVQDKERIYFRLTPQAPLVVPVDGPGRLRVITRVELAAGSMEVARYRVRAAEGGTVIEELSTESSVASDVRPIGSVAALGKSRKMTFDIAPGRHRVELTLSGTAVALVRLQHAGPARGEQPMVSLTPIEAPRSVSVVEGEKTIPYYSVLPGQPVRVRVVGPTTLELLTRLDFDATMRGTQAYRLRLTEQKKTLREVGIRTTKATAASYANLADRVPSKFDRVRVQVGNGTHEIAVELIQPLRGAAEVHARIPAPSVGNQE